MMSLPCMILCLCLCRPILIPARYSQCCELAVHPAGDGELFANIFLMIAKLFLMKVRLFQPRAVNRSPAGED